MAKEKLPAIHLYPGDWLRDSVSGCSLAAQGLWLRMMFVAHDSPKYGEMFAGDLLDSKASIARRCGCTLDEFESLFSELLNAGVPSVLDGIVYSRRMVRDATIRAARAKAGRKGGKQTAKQNSSKRQANRAANAKQNTEDEVEDESEVEIVDVSDPVNSVVAHYQLEHTRARAGKKERALIAARLREGYSVEDLKVAIDGCHASPWHCGHNERGRKYQNLELIFRDATHVNQFVELAGKSSNPQLCERSRRSLEALARMIERQPDGIPEEVGG